MFSSLWTVGTVGQWRVWMLSYMHGRDLWNNFYRRLQPSQAEATRRVWRARKSHTKYALSFLSFFLFSFREIRMNIKWSRAEDVLSGRALAWHVWGTGFNPSNTKPKITHLRWFGSSFLKTRPVSGSLTERDVNYLKCLTEARCEPVCERV